MAFVILIDHPAERIETGLDLICPDLNWSNLMTLTTDLDSDFPSYQGTLSIKCTFRGEEVYEVDGRALPVNAGNYLILNQGQRYSSYISSRTDVDSMSIFFRPGFAESVLRDIITPDDRLLDDPAGAGTGPLRFAERLYTHDSAVSPHLFNLYRTMQKGKPGKGWVEEQFHLLVPRMLDIHRGIIAELRRIPALRAVTRVEIHHRLELAVDFIHSSYTRPISLAEIARAARLSQHHFLRLFKSLHGITPHQYLTRVRLERARQLLLESDRTVMEICFDVGFESPTSFSLLFRRHFGSSPTEYRATHGGKKQFPIGDA